MAQFNLEAFFKYHSKIANEAHEIKRFLEFVEHSTILKADKAKIVEVLTEVVTGTHNLQTDIELSIEERSPYVDVE